MYVKFMLLVTESDITHPSHNEPNDLDKSLLGKWYFSTLNPI